MSSRAPANENDSKIFTRTAATTKRINVAPKVMRGGIRL